MWKKKKEHVSLTEYIAESIHIPASVQYGDSNLTITGNREVWIENYKGILEYRSDCIIVQGSRHQICLQGKKLDIVYYTNDDMKITGLITCIQFV